MCFFSTHVVAQKSNTLSVCFNPLITENTLLIKDTIYIFDKANTIKIETLKFYISHIQLFDNEKLVYTEKESYHLCDLLDSAKHNFKLKVSTSITYNTISFYIGIDSLTNVSGAMGKDLDPTKGMYWTWQSGYINFKIEGTSNLCTNPKKEFQFHIGGYTHPFFTLQTVSLKVIQSNTISVLLDVNKLLQSIDISKQQHMMSPSADAVKLSEIASKCFSSK
jgi:hypothetical protein